MKGKYEDMAREIYEMLGNKDIPYWQIHNLAEKMGEAGYKKLLINENKSNNFDVKSNNSQCIDCIHNEICQFYKTLGATVICYPCGFYEAKSNNELFKQALVEGLNRRIDKTIEEAKKIEQIEEMAKLLRPLTICFNCLSSLNDDGKRDGGCYYKGQDECIHGKFILEYCNALYNAGYRKQSEGEWNDNIIGFCNVCMNCGAIVERSAIKNNSGKLNFCPNCGSKMKGEKI